MKKTLGNVLVSNYPSVLDESGRETKKGDIYISLYGFDIDYKSFQKERVFINDKGIIKISRKRFLTLLKKEKAHLKKEISNILSDLEITVNSIEISYPFIIVNTSRLPHDIKYIRNISIAFENARFNTYYMFKFPITDIDKL